MSERGRNTFNQSFAGMAARFDTGQHFSGLGDVVPWAGFAVFWAVGAPICPCRPIGTWPLGRHKVVATNWSDHAVAHAGLFAQPDNFRGLPASHLKVKSSRSHLSVDEINRISHPKSDRGEDAFPTRLWKIGLCKRSRSSNLRNPGLHRPN